jgi:hypothetical protein
LFVWQKQRLLDDDCDSPQDLEWKRDQCTDTSPFAHDIARSSLAVVAAYCIIIFSVIFGAWHTIVLVYELSQGNA